ncbi:MAG: ABC transporter permease [Bacteroidetes bacterium]|nr:MAG: ABC transporter permease [Bacteroidota bacterium]
MLKNYFLVAIRNLFKQKGLSFINISGLSLGIACFSLFMLYAVNEFNYDKFHKNKDHIYRVYVHREALEGEDAYSSSYLPMPIAPALKSDFPGVKDAIRIRSGWGESFIKIGDKVLREKVTYADNQFFSVFSFNLKQGNPQAALKDMHSMVLTEKTAHNFFGNENAVGKTIEIKVENDYVPFTITGVCENIAPNSSIDFNMMGNFEFLTAIGSGVKSVNNWHRSSYQVFVQLTNESKLANDYKALDAFYVKYHPDEAAEVKKRGWKGKGQNAWYRMQPLIQIHTNTNLEGVGDVEAVEPKTIYILLAISAGILLIACINFTTLAIGRSAGRSKEVGVRKVVGGTRKSLVFQFLIEALLLTIVSAVLGLILGKLLLPYFNTLAGRNLDFSVSRYPELLWMTGGLIIIVSLLAGSYPSLVLSGFKPVEVLKTKVKLGGSNFFTKSLVTAQFVLSAGLIISTIVILQQLNFMRNRNPGFQKENVLVVDADGTYPRNLYPLFKHEISTNPQILGSASAELSMGEGTGSSRTGFEFQGKHKVVYEYFIDPDYLHVMGMKLLAGRDFNSSIASDTVNSIIINESMMRDFGWNINNVIGQQVKGYSESMTPVVIGVVKDFNFLSLSEKIQPQMFHQFSGNRPYKYFVRIQPGYPSKVIASINDTWNKIAPDFPFKYSFLDEDLDRFYKSEERWSNIVGCAGGVSIFLACLGLLGLAALAVINRTKEIGIRKVLGASVSHIVSIISEDFLKLVLIALAIASPLAWWLMHKWLQDYPYRINISWWIFGISGSIILLVALATISVQAIKAGLRNPVKSLRTE